MSNHYRDGDIECIDALRSALSPEEFVGFCTGNVMKYLWRWRHKGGAADLRKAEDYLRWARDAVQADGVKVATHLGPEPEADHRQEPDMVRMARTMTSAQLERYVEEMRTAQAEGAKIKVMTCDGKSVPSPDIGMYWSEPYIDPEPAEIRPATDMSQEQVEHVIDQHKRAWRTEWADLKMGEHFAAPPAVQEKGQTALQELASDLKQGSAEELIDLQTPEHSKIGFEAQYACHDPEKGWLRIVQWHDVGEHGLGFAVLPLTGWIQGRSKVIQMIRDGDYYGGKRRGRGER